MTVYFIVLILCFIVLKYIQVIDNECVRLDSGEIIHSSSAKTYYLIFSIILILVAGLRYYVGTDYGGYYLFAFTNWCDNVYEHITTFDEPVIYIINSLLSFITDDEAVSIFTLSLITIGLSLRAIYRNSFSLYEAGLLYLFLGWDATFNGVRQCLAAAVLLNGYEYIRSRKLIKFLMIVFLAFLCHRSASVMLLLYFATDREISIRNTLILASCAFVVLYSYSTLFDFVNLVMDKNYNLDDAYVSGSVNTFRILVAAVPSIVYLLLYKFKAISIDTKVALNILIIHGVAMLMAANSPMLGRIGLYTSLFVCTAIPALNEELEPSIRSKLFNCMLILYGIFWIYGLYNSYSLNNFMWIWER